MQISPISRSRWWEILENRQPDQHVYYLDDEMTIDDYRPAFISTLAFEDICLLLGYLNLVRNSLIRSSAIGYDYLSFIDLPDFLKQFYDIDTVWVAQAHVNDIVHEYQASRMDVHAIWCSYSDGLNPTNLPWTQIPIDTLLKFSVENAALRMMQYLFDKYKKKLEYSPKKIPHKDYQAIQYCLQHQGIVKPEWQWINIFHDSVPPLNQPEKIRLLKILHR